MIPNATLVSQLDDLPSLEKRSKAVQVAFQCFAVCLIGFVAVPHAIEGFQQFPLLTSVGWKLTLYVGVGSLILVFLAPISMGIYWHLLVRHALKKGVVLSSPEREVLFLFVPWFSLIRPFSTARKILFGKENTLKVALWQLSYVACAPIAYASSQGHVWAKDAHFLALGISAFLGARVMKQLTRAVQEREAL